MNENSDLLFDSPDSWLKTLLGGLYFLLTGFILIQFDIPMEWSIPAWLRTTDWLFFFGLLVPAIGFAAGFALGFPRWSYPYIGGLLVFSLYMKNTTTPLVYDFYNNYDRGWGWTVWIPFLFAALIGFLLSLRPERSAAQSKDRTSPDSGKWAGAKLFFTNMRRDLTLATYAMYAWMPLIIFIAFDEIARPYSLIFMLLLTALMVAVAILYHRAKRRESRAVILAAGLLLTLVVIEIGVISFWLPQQGVYIPGMLLYGVVIAIIILYPLWLMRVMNMPQKADAQ